MPAGKGIEKILAFGDQTSFEIEVPTYTSFLQFLDESLVQTKTAIEPDEVNGEVGRELSLEGRRVVGGDISANLRPEGGAWFLMKHAFGQVVSSQPDSSGAPSVFQHVFTLTPEVPEYGFSSKVDRDINVFSYIGMKVQAVSLDYSMDAPFGVSFTLVGRNEELGGSAPSPVYTVSLPFLDYQGVFTVNGVEQRISAFSLALANALREDDFRSGSRYRAQIERSGKRGVTGSFSRRYIDDVLYNMFVNWADASLVFTFTGAVIEGGFTYQLIITLPVVRFTGSTPGTGGVDMPPQDVPFTALRDVANAQEEITLILTNTESGY